MHTPISTMTTGQEFNLRWNNHTNNILQVFNEQFNTESLVDVTLSCEGHFLKVHRMVLSACSSYFQDIFRHPLHQVPNAVIIMNGMKFIDIKLIVEFMYKGEVKVVETELNSLLAAAETLQVKGLSNVRNKYEKGNILNASGGVATPTEMTATPQEAVGTPVHLRRKRQRLSEEMTSEGQTKSQPKPQPTPPSGAAATMPTPQTPALPTNRPLANSFIDDDDDLPAMIKVEPPDIRDIDEDPSGWESPKLVIDMDQGSRSNHSNYGSHSSETPPATRVSKRMVVNSILVKRGRGRPKKIAPAPQMVPGPDGQLVPVKKPSRKRLVPGSAAWLRKNAGKIPRPPNAFMIFANEYRRKLACDNPSENNKEISCRLGTMWKNLTAEVKEKYYTQSREADEEHKRKYPGYYYSPKEARLRKNMKSDMAELRRAPSHCDANYLVNVMMPEDATSNDEVLPARFLLYDGIGSPPQKLAPKPPVILPTQQLRPEELLVVQLQDNKIKFDTIPTSTNNVCDPKTFTVKKEPVSNDT